MKTNFSVKRLCYNKLYDGYRGFFNELSKIEANNLGDNLQSSVKTRGIEIPSTNIHITKVISQQAKNSKFYIPEMHGVELA